MFQSQSVSTSLITRCELQFRSIHETTKSWLIVTFFSYMNGTVLKLCKHNLETITIVSSSGIKWSNKLLSYVQPKPSLSLSWNPAQPFIDWRWSYLTKKFTTFFFIKMTMDKLLTLQCCSALIFFRCLSSRQTRRRRSKKKPALLSSKIRFQFIIFVLHGCIGNRYSLFWLRAVRRVINFDLPYGNFVSCPVFFTIYGGLFAVECC